ncbi:hypothetical protein A4U61_02135 [Streptomyces sp. H-KF8]|nr:hypothetical protein A4U61_02135 [Streptomyces sp. H-KF8]
MKRWLRTLLPDHLVPAAFTVLDHLPVTPNGKLDHRALPPPRFAAKETGRAPRTAREAVLCDLFGEILGTTRPVTIDDDFFDLGGHSLLAARLTHRANRTLDTRLTIRDVFQAPTVADLTTRIDGQEGGARPTRSAPVAAERPERAPLSEAQRRLWLQASMDGHGTAYNVPLAVRLDGAVDPAALRAAFRDLVRRHEVLRTVVVQEDGDTEPWQRILDADAPDVLAFEVLPSSRERIEDDLRSAAAHVFEPTRRPPLRVTLFEQVPGERYVLSVVLHHIATDGQSVRPLFEDLAEAYRARLAGEAPGWRPLPVQYADYAHWQRRTLVESGALEGDLAYWKQALAGLPEEPGLRPDRPRPAQAGHLGGAVPVSFGPDVMNGVRRLARAERCTPFMVLHAALVATLTRMGAGTDVPIGSPVAGRSSDELRGLVGFFVNTLVLRADASGDPSFRDLLARVRRSDLDAFAHQEAPFDRVLEAVNPVRSLSRHPLFQVCLVLEDGEDLTVELPGTARTYARVVDTPTAKYDWEFLLRDDPVEGLSGAVLYSAEIYDPATAERMVRAFRAVLESALADPDLALSAVDVLAPGERVRVVEHWNDTGAPAEHRSVPAVFAAQAARTPEATATIFGTDHLTYRQLDTRSSQLAHHLNRTGCHRGEVTGVLLERGTDLALTLLAVLKTGAAYAVLDPDHPDDRLTTTLTDAGITTVITHSHHHRRLPHHVTAITLDTLDLHHHPTTAPPDRTTPQDAACLMFTSGSTGRPKAVLTPHHAITGTLHHQTYTPLGPTHTTLQCSPTGWDAFSLEFWGALLHGATTILHPGQKPEPDTIHHLTRTHPVTTLQTSSTLFNYLVDHHPTTFEHLHTAFTGGEPASPAHVARILARYPHLRVVNGYGPAESMGFTTVHEVLTPQDASGSTLPIGRPITNKQAYVLDTALRPVPIGVTGELYLAGTGLAHGYHHQPALTATRFVPHPYGPPGTRLYRTGDLAHWTTHGHLHYDGRTDTQIKIRGFRIEPAEIEHTLLRHPHITQAAVTPTTNPTGHPCLAAYLTTTDTGLDASEVKRWLRTLLPDHLVPAAFTVLDHLPVTPNGKLDHRALPPPRFAVAERGRGPRTDRERLLCDLFGEILGTTRPVTIDDDFFDLGGHSLLAARLTHRANHTLDTRLTIRDVFQAPTVADLTTRIDTMTRAEGDGTASVRRARPALRRRTSAGALLPQD